MDEKKQRMAIAESALWIKPDKQISYTHPEWWWMQPDGRQMNWVPDYLNDLNAMAEAEKVLTHAQCIAYHECLNHIQATDTQERDGVIEYQAQDFWFHATAPQRAEAFLRTLNLWES